MILPLLHAISRVRCTGAIHLAAALALCSGSLADAQTPAPDVSLGAGVVDKPIYRRHTRFSGQSGIITFTTERPRERTIEPATRIAAPVSIKSKQSVEHFQARYVAVSSSFGMRMHPILGIAREHRGVDLAAPAGSPIFAPSSGIVGQAGWSGGYGIALSLEHGGGIETRYGHLSRLNVVPGQTVREGDILGYVGSTGLSTGPHLHYELRVNGQAVNPMAAAGIRTRR